MTRRGLNRLLRFVRDQLRDPLLDAEYVEDYQPGPARGRRFSPGSYVRIAGVERDAVPWPPKGGASKAARGFTTGTRFRG